MSDAFYFQYILFCSADHDFLYLCQQRIANFLNDDFQLIVDSNFFYEIDCFTGQKMPIYLIVLKNKLETHKTSTIDSKPSFEMTDLKVERLGLLVNE